MEETQGRRQEVTVTIAVTGKGGTGKTTIAALLIRILAEKTRGVILAIDADPNSNLNEALGVPSTKTVGDIRERLLNDSPQEVEQSKSEYMEGMIQSSIMEGEGFDLIVMGRPEGPGCYCYVNHFLRKIIDSTASKYDYVVMDAEAGLEHFSRRTTRDVDILLIATDPTAKGIATARRIAELVRELRIRVGRVLVVANRVPDRIVERLRNQITKEGLECVQVIPEDLLVQEFDFEGKPLTALPQASLAYQALQPLAKKLLLRIEERSSAWWDKV